MKSKKQKILVADDDPYILDCLSMILQDEGYTVETLQNGKVLTYLKNSLPDLLLLDLWMSGINGRDICKTLKNIDSMRHVPVIMISANTDIAYIAKDGEADDYLMKPFDVSVLLRKVESFMS